MSDSHPPHCPGRGNESTVHGTLKEKVVDFSYVRLTFEAIFVLHFLVGSLQRTFLDLQQTTQNLFVSGDGLVWFGCPKPALESMKAIHLETHDALRHRM